jgi:hypothetical protein
MTNDNCDFLCLEYLYNLGNLFLTHSVGLYDVYKKSTQIQVLIPNMKRR